MAVAYHTNMSKTAFCMTNSKIAVGVADLVRCEGLHWCDAKAYTGYPTKAPGVTVATPCHGDGPMDGHSLQWVRGDLTHEILKSRRSPSLSVHHTITSSSRTSSL